MPVRIEKNGPVTTVILNRPEVRNAVDHATALELQVAFQALEADEDATVGVLWGDNGTLCAGYDLKTVAAGNVQGTYTPEGDGPLGVSRMLLNKPVIAGISGYAVAGGLELALWCDLRIMEEDAQVGVFCRRWGVPLVDGGTVRLPRLIGMSRALDLILTGRAVGAQEALLMGLCNRVVAKGYAREAAEQLAHEIARFPQICLRADRMSAYLQWDLDLVEALKNEGRGGMAPLRTEARAGAARFANGKGRGGSFQDI
jgi:enoyl-CoA hydratase